MIKIYCDRCGKEMDNYDEVTIIESCDSKTIIGQIYHITKTVNKINDTEINLCAGCESDFTRWLEEYDGSE